MKLNICIVITLILLIPFIFTATSKNGNNEWNKTYGGEGTERAQDLIEVEDGFLFTGYKKCQNKDFEGWVVKVDKQGSVLWNKTYGGKKEDILHYILPTDDGYLLVGYSLSFGGKTAGFWLISIDEQGNEYWNKTYLSSDTDYAQTAVVADDGYIITGMRVGSEGRIIWAIKTDTEGSEIWNRTYRAGEDCYCIKKITDGYLLGGEISTYGCLIKITETGEMEWVRIYSEVDTISDIVIEENGYVLLGNSPLSLIKTDTHGNQIWLKAYGWGNVGRAMIRTDDGYAIAGSTDRYSLVSSNVWLFLVDEEGNEYWNKSFGGKAPETGHDIIQIDDGFLILANIQEGWDAWLIKCNDYPPPQLTINKPRENHLYLFDREIFSTKYTIIIGDITLSVEVEDSDVNIDRVEFYMYRRGMFDKEIQETIYFPPYEWHVYRATAGTYELAIGAYYGNAGAVTLCKTSFLMLNL